MIRTLTCCNGNAKFEVKEYHRVPDVQDHHAMVCNECGHEYHLRQIEVDDENGKLVVEEEETALDHEAADPE